jgi:ATP-dependent DNA ligase
VESRVRYVDHIHERGVAFFELACSRDIEGVVGKWQHGTYQTGQGSSWVKVKHAQYSQNEGRAELFNVRPTYEPLRRKPHEPVQLVLV